VGGYDVNTGRKGDRHVQAHEAPVAIRIREAYGQGVVYVEDAVVQHTLFEYRGRFRWLVFRAFWQGYSKRVMELLLESTISHEVEYLNRLLVEHIPGRSVELLHSPSRAKVKQLMTLGVFTVSVGIGYLYGIIRLGHIGE
jgi:hypothetical protein